MLDFRGIYKVLDKLRDENEPGKTEIIEGGRKEIRCSYYFNDRLIFTFGLTRSSRAKSKTFNYVPRQMGITRTEYRGLHGCPMSKRDYNQKLLDSEDVK